ncbi:MULTISPECIES: hypothetical protein [unclassified Shinella]|uniref:hypothetical protein n=1 Tax=unclassified Shinella TaxID=2643062 RepID=UPI00225C94CE|nr:MULTISPECIES: hypothetical protein [unclassified Shinella]MCO5139086.1 hypothetical protein [Shinella sp.]MDC7256184.1 hypothetical protein [Shinella sp. YE25]CAI0339033.1 hypothetical protein SHINE37_42887 [Rhizobiaceae bacterium]
MEIPVREDAFLVSPKFFDEEIPLIGDEAVSVERIGHLTSTTGYRAPDDTSIIGYDDMLFRRWRSSD